MSLWFSQSRQRVVLAMLPFLMAAAGGCKPAPSWPLWNSYAAHFIDSSGRVVDPMRGSATTSEGQSYALFFALVSNDRARFDQLLGWTQNNLAVGDMSKNLPGWLWGKAPDGTWKLLDTGQAADSDCWIAYSLIEAGRLWKNDAYTTLGRSMLANIAQRETANLPGFGWMLMPGPSANYIHGELWTLDPSYLPPFLFERLAQVDPHGPWKAIAANIPKLLKESAKNGFAMDFVNYAPATGFIPAPALAPAEPGKTLPPAVGSYDAIRVYLWAGMSDASQSAHRGAAHSGLSTAVNGMANYLTNHGAPPEKVSDEGVPMAQDGPVGFSAALLPYLRAFPKSDQAVSGQQARVDAQLDKSTGLYGKDPTYYDQNLILFAQGFGEKRFGFGANGELKVEWAN
jgi:endo-1,4-beta-D-glucanase Y